MSQRGSREEESPMETTRRAPLDYIELTGQKPLDDARENGIRGI